MYEHQKLSPYAANASPRGFTTISTPTNSHGVEPTAASERERIQQQKMRLLNYSPPMATANIAAATQHAIGINMQMERRRTSAGII